MASTSDCEALNCRTIGGLWTVTNRDDRIDLHKQSGKKTFDLT